jgi:acetyl-CoA carboxylase biotin carboxyl carrier protein
MNLTHDDVQAILKIVDAAEHLEEVEIVHGGFRLHLVRSANGALRQLQDATGAPPRVESHTATRTDGAGAMAPAAAVTREIAPAPTQVPEGIVAIRAPMLGVFYRAPAPGEKPFVEVGQHVRADDTVCLIEVMKLFNSIRAGVDGEVVEILVENGGLVEFDQALIFIRPA